ncbi:Mcm2-7 hexameric complex component, partial [Coemansia sp. RSA 2681]
LRQQYKAALDSHASRRARSSIDTGAGAARERSNIGNTTPRTLLAILRLAQARARIRAADQVATEDVDEALRLMDAAHVTLDSQPAAASGIFGERQQRSDPVSSIFAIMTRQLATMQAASASTSATSSMPQLSYSDILSRTRDAGFSEADLSRCLQQYEDINILQVNLTRTRITFVSAPTTAATD